MWSSASVAVPVQYYTVSTASFQRYVTEMDIHFWGPPISHWFKGEESVINQIGTSDELMDSLTVYYFQRCI